VKVTGKRKKYVVGEYLLKYSMDGVKYSYGNIFDSLDWNPKLFPNGVVDGLIEKSGLVKKMLFESNNEPIPASQIEIPDSLLASSIMLTDKFVFLAKPDEFSPYKYLGIRASRSTAGTRSYIKNTINLLAKSKEKDIFNKGLPRILNFLELENYMILTYSVKRKEIFFTGNLNKEAFHSFIKEYELNLDKRREKEGKTIIPWFALQHYKNILKDDSALNKLISFCNKTSGNLKQNKSSGNFYFEYDLIKDLGTLESEIQFINTLEKLNLIGYPELCFRKKGNLPYNFEGASSGEAHFITSIIGILATIKENSLIFIDEPEISLHPNWQMKYLSFLREVFGIYTNCHFIIATHSHFLISDLEGATSNIIPLRREKGKIEVVELPKNINTFGWSAEEVLYSVFNVRSTRNSFLEYDLTKLVTLVNRNSEDYKEIKRIVGKISTLVLNDNDPLKILKEKAEKYLKENYA
jgi:hypothetical protein